MAKSRRFTRKAEKDNEVGKIIREYRARKGWSLAKLGTYLGYTSGQVIYHFESGRNLPNFREIDSIEKALKIPYHELAKAVFYERCNDLVNKFRSQGFMFNVDVHTGYTPKIK